MWDTNTCHVSNKLLVAMDKGAAPIMEHGLFEQYGFW